jgi:NAD(P)-dependent dehydrogenase (short-subunit alcohol dehydrogenase family)
MAEVRRLADHIKQRFSELHSLIHCAAVILKSREITPEGFEATFATNVMAPFLLSQLLYEPLQLGRPSRVVFFYGGGKSSFDLGNLMSERHFDGWAAYNQTKNANVMVSIEMGQQWQSAGIAVNSVFPGLVKTAILREIPWYLRAILTPLRPLLRTPTEGAAAPVWAVTAPELATVSGKLFGSLVGDPRREFQLPRVTRNSHNRQQLVNLLRVWTSLSAGQEGMAPPRAVA